MDHKSFSRAAFALAACSAALLGLSAARAADFSAEYVFGDSLSDNGNLAAAYRKFPNPPSFNNSFTNGPVAVQLLAESLGFSANASLWLTAPAFLRERTTRSAERPPRRSDRRFGINLLNQVGAYSPYAVGPCRPERALCCHDRRQRRPQRRIGQATGAAAITAGVDTELAAISTLIE